MREISIESFGQNIEGFLHAAQAERLLVTQGGKPLPVLVGVKNKDQGDWDLENSREFWRMIEDRRRECTLPWKEVRDSLLEAN